MLSQSNTSVLSIMFSFISLRAMISNITTCLFYIFCVIGCIKQIGDLSAIYFRYLVVTDLTIKIPTEVNAPALSVCIRYTDIFNTSAFTSANNITGIVDFQFSNRTLLQTMATIQDLFDYTPDARYGLISKCRVRYPLTYDSVSLNGTECHKLIDVDKFYLQEFICYRFQFMPATNGTYYYRNLAYALTYPGMFYKLIFDLNTFYAAELMKLIVHEASTYPLRSAAYSPSITRGFNSTDGSAKYNGYQISYSMLENHRLPPPYTTDCRDYTQWGYSSGADCIKNCTTIATLAAFDKVPFSTITRYSTNKKHLNTDDIANSTIKFLLSTIEVKCSQRCAQRDCYEFYSLTRTEREPLGKSFSITVNIPKEPSFEMKFLEKISLTEYLIYVLSILGTWFGVSVINVNPFRVNTYRRVRDTVKEIVSSKSDRIDQNGMQFMGNVYSDNHSNRTKTVERQCKYCAITRTLLRNEIRHEMDSLSDVLIKLVC